MKCSLATVKSLMKSFSCILLCCLTIVNTKNIWIDSENDGAVLQSTDVRGRIVEIPARDYILSFKVKAPMLGECALEMKGNAIRTCTDKFGGVEVWIPRASTGVDVSRVQTVDDILTHGMGGIGATVGVLGLASVGLKFNVAVTTQTSSKHLTLMSSYDVKLGAKTLSNPFPMNDVGPGGSLFLSEIEFGGNEMFLVTIEFESSQSKIDVQMQLQVKILFITITAKLRYVKETFSSTFKTRIQFKSSWRESLDKTYSSLDDAIDEVERIEKMYANGPQELRAMDKLDEKLHHTYHFSSWGRSPYGNNTNLATVNYEVSILNEQIAEIVAVIKRLDDTFETGGTKFQDPKKKEASEQLKQQMINLSEKLTTALQTYHSLTQPERSQLLHIYGDEKSPGYYQRQLRKIIGH